MVTSVFCCGVGCVHRYSYPQSSLPKTLAPPRQKPDVPTRVSLAAASGSTIRTIWFAPESDGGDIVLKYRVEWDTVRTFDSGPDRTPLGSHELVVTTGQCGVHVSDRRNWPFFVRCILSPCFMHCRAAQGVSTARSRSLLRLLSFSGE